MEFGVLGPLAVRDSDGGELSVAGPKQRSLLALLLIHPGEVLGAERIIDELWGAVPPSGGRRTLRFHVSKLRDALEPGRPRGSEGTVIVTEPAGYTLAADAHTIDVRCFEELAAEGHAALRKRPGWAAERLRRAIALWRGPALDDFRYEQFAQAEIARLEELRVAAVEDRIEADLATGAAASVVGELEMLTHEHPLRERIRSLHMRALYGTGRQAAALRAYQGFRRDLAEQIGIDPSPDLQTLEEQILHQDPALALQMTPSGALHNLPAPVSTFVGRQRELDAIRALVQDRRLVTLVGAGGSGKTRLALEVADSLLADYPDGAWLIDFSSLRDPALVPHRAASALGLREQPGRPITMALADHIAERTLLLVLDNCEHLVDAVASLAEQLLRTSPGLTILATSRERLGVGGESRWEVPGLDLPAADAPADAAAILNSDAVQLLVVRAREVRPEFVVAPTDAPAVSLICRRLDRMPLAIELAAARIRMFDLDQILERLSDRFGFLTDGGRTADERHRTLEATMDWSYDLLDEEAGRTLRALSVFRGGFTLEQAHVVVAGTDDTADDVLDLVSRLIDCSLVTAGALGTRRYHLLQTVREYALRRLTDAGERQRVIDRHSRYFERQAAQAHERMRSPDRTVWIHRMTQDLDNFDAALERSMASGEFARAAAMAGNLWPLWHLSGHFRGGLDALSRVLAGAPALPSATLRNVHHGIAALASSLGDYDPATSSAAVALDLLGDDEPAERAMLLITLGGIRYGRGEIPAATASWTEARRIAEQAADERQWAFASSKLAWAHAQQGEGGAARSLADAALEAARRAGDAYVIAEATLALAEAYFELEDLEMARVYGRDALTLAEQASFLNQASWARYTLGRLNELAGESGALDHLNSAVRGFRTSGEEEGIVYAQVARAHALVDRGEFSEAAAALENARSISASGPQHTQPPVREGSALLAARLGRPGDAQAYLTEADDLRARLGLPPTTWDRWRRKQLVEMLGA